MTTMMKARLRLNLDAKRSRVPEWKKADWKAYGRLLAEARERAKLTLRELAQRVGVSYSTLNYLERGRSVYRRTLARVEKWLARRAK